MGQKQGGRKDRERKERVREEEDLPGTTRG